MIITSLSGSVICTVRADKVKTILCCFKKSQGTLDREARQKVKKPPPRLHPCRRDDQRAQPPAGHHAGRHQADDRQGEIEQKCQQSQFLKSWKKRNTVSLKLNEIIRLGERYPLSLLMLCRFISSQVDRDGDGRISYSEFRVMMGANPLIIS